jgi:hypothetical protein
MGWQRTDDLDGSPATEVTFGLEGQAYVLDLGAVEHEKLCKALQRWLTVAKPYAEMPVPPKPVASVAESSATVTPIKRVSAARKSTKGSHAPGRIVRAKPVVQDGGKLDHALVRTWANQNGFTVSPKGRISSQVIEEYRHAH